MNCKARVIVERYTLLGATLALIKRVRKTSPETYVSAIVVFTFWLVLWAFLWLVPGFVGAAQPWIELLNGATWPSAYPDKWNPCAFWLAGAVATRSAINLGVPLAVIAFNVLIFTGGLGRIMKMSLIELVGLQNSELIARLSDVLSQRHPIDDDDRAAMRAVAEELLKEWAAQDELKDFEPER